MVFISRWQPNIHHSQIIARAVRVICDSNFGLQSQGKYQGCLQKQSGDRNQWAFAQAQHRLNTSKKQKEPDTSQGRLFYVSNASIPAQVSPTSSRC